MIKNFAVGTDRNNEDLFPWLYYNNKNYNSGLTYGYGTQYKTTLKNMIKKHNLIINNDFNYIVIDVKTQKELEKIDYFTQI